MRRAQLSDGGALDVDVVLTSLGSIRNVEWLDGAGLAAGYWGVGCDAGCRVFDINGVVTDHLRGGRHRPCPACPVRLRVPRDGTLGQRGAGCARERAQHGLRRDRSLAPLTRPAFWSGQFGVNIKSVGVPFFGDEIVFTQGSVKQRRFAAAYGRSGRIVGAVTFNHGKWIDHYASRSRGRGRSRRLRRVSIFPRICASWPLTSRRAACRPKPPMSC